MRCEWYLVLVSMNTITHGPFYSKRYAEEQLNNMFPKEDYVVVPTIMKEQGEL